MAMSAWQITDEKTHGKHKSTYPARTQHITTRKSEAKKRNKKKLGGKKL